MSFPCLSWVICSYVNSYEMDAFQRYVKNCMFYVPYELSGIKFSSFNVGLVEWGSPSSHEVQLQVPFHKYIINTDEMHINKNMGYDFLMIRLCFEQIA